MNAGREVALEIALRSVLSMVKAKGINLDEMCEEAASEMIGNPMYNVLAIPDAINEIEMAVDALPVESPVEPPA
ncbi:hypothetical protein ACIPL1_06275 [Pseudomonas sp. NPDC090202]|uniref:hypothetical protein n=1 Tax=unclassified Pseudomonas TaxID=196821 RepID=UPI00382BBA19